MLHKSDLTAWLRTLSLAICLVLGCASLSAQDRLFKQFENTKGVSTVYISPAMFKLMPKLNVGDKDLAKLASRLSRLQILQCERPSLIPSIKKQAQAYYDSNRYEVIMRVKDDGEHTTIYQKGAGRGAKEFVLLNEEKNELSIIHITGNISLEDIKDLYDR